MLSAALLLSSSVASHSCAPVTLLSIVEGAPRFIGGMFSNSMQHIAVSKTLYLVTINNKLK